MRVLATKPVAKAPQQQQQQQQPQVIVIRPSDETAREAEMDHLTRRQVQPRQQQQQQERRERQLQRQFEEGDNPTDGFPMDPLFPEVEGYDAALVERDSLELATLARQTLAILKQNEAILQRIRKRQEREPTSSVPGTPASAGAGPSPAKRMTPGSADGDQQVIDAVIGDLISKMYAQSPALRSLSPVEGADIIGQLFAYDAPEKSQLIDTYIDAAIADTEFVRDMARVQLSGLATESLKKDMPIGCFAPGCVSQATHRCKDCKSAYYCSSECQEAHWENGHDLVCQTK